MDAHEASLQRVVFGAMARLEIDDSDDAQAALARAERELTRWRASQIAERELAVENEQAALVSRANDLHDAILFGIYDTAMNTVGDMQPAIDALSALYDMAVKGGAK